MSRPLQNFGKNVQWTPSNYYQPRTEKQLIAILEQHHGEQIRAMASLHSWSPVAATTGITIDLKAFNQVRIIPDEQSVWLGAGCTIQRALDQLRRQGGWTLPAIGAIKKQTIAGAISTGTHGSGSQGMSHFVQAVRIARYCQESKDVLVEQVSDGEELRAIRCGLGCLGVILEVRLVIRQGFLVEETLRMEPNLSSLLTHFSDHPLSFFVQAPYTDELVIWERREISSSKMTMSQRLLAFLYRTHNFWGVDLGFHLIISVLARLKLPALKKFFTVFPRLLLQNKSVVDDSEHQLTLAHDLFRHEEMEVFIPEEHLEVALRFIGTVIKLFADEEAELSPKTQEQLEKMGLLGSLRDYRGSYLHHYPLSIRRVHPEDTLISMASGDRIWYSVSFFTYSDNRGSFYDFCYWLARACLGLYGARLHWGKYCPLSYQDLAPHYPNLERFREICRDRDPEGVFQNAFTRRVLGT